MVSPGGAEARLQFVGVVALGAIGHAQQAAHKDMFTACADDFPLPGWFYVHADQIFALLAGSHIQPNLHKLR
jgi:hypothetical protein